MVVIGWVLMFNLELILFDEISFGFVLVIIKIIYDVLFGIIGEGMMVMIVE